MRVVVAGVKAMENGGPFKMFHVKHLSELIESCFSKMPFLINSLKSWIILLYSISLGRMA